MLFAAHFISAHFATFCTLPLLCAFMASIMTYVVQHDDSDPPCDDQTPEQDCFTAWWVTTCVVFGCCDRVDVLARGQAVLRSGVLG